MTEKPGGGRFDESKAKAYDARIAKAIPGYDALHDLARCQLRALLGDEARVLVAGCGTGAELLRLALECPRWRFAGFDPAPAMLAEARGKIEAAGVADRVRLIEGIVADVPPDPPFDAALQLLVMHFVPDDGAKLSMLAGLARRLKPGAPFLIADMNGVPDDETWRRQSDAWRLLQLANGIPAEDVERGFRYAMKDVHPISEPRLFSLLDEAGFRAPERFFQAYRFSGFVTFKK